MYATLNTLNSNIIIYIIERDLPSIIIIIRLPPHVCFSFLHWLMIQATTGSNLVVRGCLLTPSIVVMNCSRSVVPAGKPGRGVGLLDVRRFGTSLKLLLSASCSPKPCPSCPSYHCLIWFPSPNFLHSGRCHQPADSLVRGAGAGHQALGWDVIIGK